MNTLELFVDTYFNTVFSQSVNLLIDPLMATQDPIRFIERQSILTFLTSHASYFTGRVLDYGCGSQLYRSIVERRGAEYIPWDLGEGFPYFQEFDAVLCTQVIQYVDNIQQLFMDLFRACKPSGYIILTYPTNWDEVPNDHYHGHCDKWRFTKVGMEAMFKWLAECEILHHELRAVVQLGTFRFPLGYGLIARKKS